MKLLMTRSLATFLKTDGQSVLSSLGGDAAHHHESWHKPRVVPVSRIIFFGTMVFNNHRHQNELSNVPNLFTRDIIVCVGIAGDHDATECKQRVKEDQDDRNSTFQMTSFMFDFVLMCVGSFVSMGIESCIITAESNAAGRFRHSGFVYLVCSVVLVEPLALQQRRNFLCVLHLQQASICCGCGCSDS